MELNRSSIKRKEELNSQQKLLLSLKFKFLNYIFELSILNWFICVAAEVRWKNLETSKHLRTLLLPSKIMTNDPLAEQSRMKSSNLMISA